MIVRLINSQVTTVRHQGKEWLCYVPRGMTGEVYEIRRGGDKVVLMVTWSKVFRTAKDLDGLRTSEEVDGDRFTASWLTRCPWKTSSSTPKTN